MGISQRITCITRAASHVAAEASEDGLTGRQWKGARQWRRCRCSPKRSTSSRWLDRTLRDDEIRSTAGLLSALPALLRSARAILGCRTLRPPDPIDRPTRPGDLPATVLRGSGARLHPTLRP